MSQRLDGQAKGSGQPKISNLESSRLVNEQILRLEVAVDDASGVAVVESVAKLIEEKLDLIAGHGLLVLSHVFLEVVVHQLKH